MGIYFQSPCFVRYNNPSDKKLWLSLYFSSEQEIVFKYSVDWQPVGVSLTGTQKNGEERGDNQSHLRSEVAGCQ